MSCCHENERCWPLAWSDIGSGLNLLGFFSGLKVELNLGFLNIIQMSFSYVEAIKVKRLRFVVLALLGMVFWVPCLRIYSLACFVVLFDLCRDIGKCHVSY